MIQDFVGLHQGTVKQSFNQIQRRRGWGGGTGLLAFLEKVYKAEKFLYFLLKLPLAYDIYGICIGP